MTDPSFNDKKLEKINLLHLASCSISQEAKWPY